MEEIQKAIEELMDRFDYNNPAYEKEYNENYQAVLQLLSTVAEKQRSADYSYYLITKNHLMTERQRRELLKATPLVTDTLNQIKCSECGEYFNKKEIVIQGDKDTCDDCLCPE